MTNVKVKIPASISNVRVISRAAVERGAVAILSDSSDLVLAVVPNPAFKRIRVAVFDRHTGAAILAGWRHDAHGDKYVEGWRVIDEALLYAGMVRDFGRLWASYKSGCNLLTSIFNQRGCVRNLVTAKEIIAYCEQCRRASPGVRAAAWFVTSFGESFRVPKRFRS